MSIFQHAFIEIQQEGAVKLNKPKLWTKDFIFISVTSFFVALTFYMLMTTLTVYAVEQFQASQSKAGLASSIFVIGAVFSRLFAGKYIEVIGRKRLIYGSLLLFLISTLLYFTVTNLNVLLVVRFIHGAAFGIATTALSTAVMDMIPKERRGEGTSYYTLSSSAATAFGPFIGLLITQYADFKWIFVACTIFSVSSIVMTLFLKVPEAQVTKEQLQAMKQGFKLQDFFEKKAVPISLIMILMGVAYSGVVTFLNLYAIEIDLAEAASFFFMVYAVFLFISRPFTGKLLDLKGDNIVIYPALIFFTISLFLLYIVNSGFVLLLSGAFLALGFGTMMSSSQAIAIKESPRHRVGLATSTFFICLDTGVGIGPFLTGMIVPFVGLRGMYLFLAVLVLLSIAMYYFLHGKKSAVRKDNPEAA
ncbi:MFS transporter [Bacillus dakarensis]|uniref:MFS transporter n=1 Tax=Robertmurraya dakarensis TaxID=1926278 RepID=UPI001F47CCA2|nr:MFS transporter [Bacillus dakarensis]